MITFRLLKVGKPAFGEYEKLVTTYVERIRHFLPCEYQVLRDQDPRATAAKLKDTFGFGSSRPKGKPPILVCFDERGQNLSSTEIAAKLRQFIESSRDVCFLIGGPYGIDAEILENAHARWCLSKATLTSDMAWLIGTEQIYRALTILNNQPYHHA
jgi:23S rRNA (pseudouridine1915-N3)-methyltransferase